MKQTADWRGEGRQAAVSAPVKREKKREEEPAYSVNELEEARRQAYFPLSIEGVRTF